MIQAREALDRLLAGNLRFAAEKTSRDSGSTRARRGELMSGQAPFAVILGCSDSRVPAELVFDQGLGDLFVIRVAGNIVTPSQIGSVEFAVDRFDTRLVVVLGHSGCGAVQATLEELHRPTEERSPNLATIVDCIVPSVEGLLPGSEGRTPDDVLDEAVRANIVASVEGLRHGSKLLEAKARAHGLLIVGAEYSLETGVVDFFEE